MNLVINRKRYAPRVAVRSHPLLERMGTDYGGWVFVAVPELVGCDIISCGLGEDASFDVQFAARFGARVVIVDPTPRAIQHFRAIEMRLGESRTSDAKAGGRQPVDSYDLSEIVDGQLVLIDKALTDSCGMVRFYQPANPEHVSHSVVNFQHGYSSDTPFIEVESTTFERVIDHVEPERLQIVKLDIEGAEISVIPHILRGRLHPPQICVEFDEMSTPSARARANFETCHKLLTAAGYVVAFHDGRTNFLYVQESLY